MTDILRIVGPILAASGFAPYLLSTIKGKVKPRVASWATWTMVTGIATAAELSKHSYTSALLTGIATIPEALILVMALRNGDFDYSWVDGVSQILSIAGIIFWLSTSSPMGAIVANILADLFGAVPTFYHIWIKPHEEAWLPFLISAVGSGMSLLAVANFGIVAAGFPIYLLLIDSSLSLSIFLRQKAVGINNIAYHSR